MAVSASPVAMYTFHGCEFAHDGVRCACRTTSMSTSLLMGSAVKSLAERRFAITSSKSMVPFLRLLYVHTYCS